MMSVFFGGSIVEVMNKNLLQIFGSSAAGPFIFTKVVHIPSPRVQMVKMPSLWGGDDKLSKSPCCVFLIHGN